MVVFYVRTCTYTVGKARLTGPSSMPNKMFSLRKSTNSFLYLSAYRSRIDCPTCCCAYTARWRAQRSSRSFFFESDRPRACLAPLKCFWCPHSGGITENMLFYSRSYFFYTKVLWGKILHSYCNLHTYLIDIQHAIIQQWIVLGIYKVWCVFIWLLHPWKCVCDWLQYSYSGMLCIKDVHTVAALHRNQLMSSLIMLNLWFNKLTLHHYWKIIKQECFFHK